MRKTWDEYRVSLFKKKIRAVLPEIPRIRFERSIGRCNLIINLNVSRKYAKQVSEFILSKLKANGIEAKAEAMFDCFPGPDYITIPIDQAALPERRRPA